MTVPRESGVQSLPGASAPGHIQKVAKLGDDVTFKYLGSSAFAQMTALYRPLVVKLKIKSGTHMLQVAYNEA